MRLPKQARHQYPEEDEQYWLGIYSHFKKSGQSRKAYCKAQGINYDRFGYWLSRKTKAPALIAVKVTHVSSVDTHLALASLRLSSTHAIVFHDVEALCAIMTRLS